MKTRAAVLLGVLAALTGCSRRPAAMRPSFAPEVSGCAALTASRACTVAEDGELRILVPKPGDVTFDADGKDLPGERLASTTAGTLHRVRVPAGAHRLRVVVHGAEVAEGVVEVRADAPPAWLLEGRARATKGDRDGALALYAEHARAQDPAEAAAAAGQAGRVELGRGHVDASATWLRDAVTKDREAGRLSDAVDDALSLAFALGQRSHRYTEARAALDGIADLLDAYPDGRAREPYYRAQLVSETGDRREALRLLREGERRATRLGLTRLERLVRMMTAIELDAVGRLEEARQIRRALEAELEGAKEACDRLAVRSGLGFGLVLLAKRAGGDRALAAEASVALERARGETGCGEPYLHAVTFGNLAFAALEGGRVDEAGAFLAKARALAPSLPASESFFWLDLQGRIALARGDAAGALAVYDEMEQRARAAVLPETEWAALAGRAAALQALGRKREARASLARAESMLDDASFAVPMGEGRARFLVERVQSSAAAVDLLVEAGQRDEAFAVARRARRRVLAGLEAAHRLDGMSAPDRARWDEAVSRYARERAAISEEAARDWKLLVAELAPARASRKEREAAMRSALEDALAMLSAGRRGASTVASDPAPGEVVLLLHPASRGGWTELVQTRTGTAAFHVPALDPAASAETLAARLLTPARDALAHGTRLLVLLPGALAHVDVHALPYEGAPLVARLPVAYGVDLGPGPGPGDGPALVVGDPQRDLPLARAEAQEVAEALRDEPAGVRLLQRESATHAGVAAALERASAFHYAGHGVHEGEDGWNSALPLAAGGALTVSDVLALGAPPTRVVLSGCDAARSDRDSPGETLGVAQAFLVAGSRAVVAPSRPVADALAARFVRHLYEASKDHRDDLPAAVRAAQMRTREDDSAGDWAAFRVLVR